nr:uncharacterized protein LOC109155364 [Ipomoea batatas]
MPFTGKSRLGASINNKTKVRGIAKPLVRALTTFNARQREDVIEIGFGGLLDFLQIGNPLLTKWREELRQPKGKVTVLDLCNELLTHNNGGIWFKRHFSVAVVSTLLENEHNGYVNKKIVHMFGNMNGMPELDLCGYLLKCLVSTHEDWTTFRRLKYTGPVFFLMGGGKQPGQHKRKVSIKRVDFKAIETEGGMGDFYWGGILKSKMMQMAWHVPTNKHDSDVYTMRHMESFLSQEPGEWNCELVKEDVEQLVNLRKRFMHKDSITMSLAHYSREMFGRTVGD